MNVNVVHRDLEITLEFSYTKSESKHSFGPFDDVRVILWSHSLGFLGPADWSGPLVYECSCGEHVYPLGLRGWAHLLSSKVHVQGTLENRQLAISLG